MCSRLAEFEGLPSDESSVPEGAGLKAKWTPRLSEFTYSMGVDHESVRLHYVERLYAKGHDRLAEQVGDLNLVARNTF